MSATWDIFHSDRMEVERGLTAEQVRRGIAEGRIVEDDLVRPAGAPAPWTPLSESPEFNPGAVPPAPPRMTAEFVDDDAPMIAEFVDDDSPIMAEFVDDAETGAEETPEILPVTAPSPVPTWGEPVFVGDEDEHDPLDEDEEVAEFTLTRSGPEKIEELDLAAMVDVAFQLVLFFLVTATTVLYRSLEIPKPNNDSQPEAATQGRGKSMDDLKSNFILVEIDATGGMKLDREPLPEGITLEDLAERLRASRRDTDRDSMLLSADFATPHKNAVLAYDAANEIGLRIAIAKPTGGPPEGGGDVPLPIKNPNQRY